MKNNRLAFRTINIVAAIMAGLAIFLPWLDSVAAIRIDFIRLVSSEAVSPTDTFLFSIAMAIFVGAFLTLMGGIFASKYLAVIGWLIDLIVLVLWIVMTVMYSNSGNINFVIGDLQAGVWVMLGSIILTLVSLFLRTKAKPKVTEKAFTAK